MVERPGTGGLLTKTATDLSGLEGIGLSGQMHGAVLLDEKGEVLRTAIFWNDGRSGKECLELEETESELSVITGNLAMPGFTAPKLLWVQKHEPHIFKQIHKVLLPKDYLRYKLSGETISDRSDSAGTLWLDTETLVVGNNAFCNPSLKRSDPNHCRGK